MFLRFRFNACIFSTPSIFSSQCTGLERLGLNLIPRVPRSRSGRCSACRTVQRKHPGQHANFTSTGIPRLAHCLIPPFCWTSPGSGIYSFVFPFNRVFSSEVFGGWSGPTLINGQLVYYLFVLHILKPWQLAALALVYFGALVVLYPCTDGPHVRISSIVSMDSQDPRLNN